MLPAAIVYLGRGSEWLEVSLQLAFLLLTAYHPAMPATPMV